MNVRLAYHGHSGVAGDGARQTVALAPNLAREPVAFDAPLLRPLRFREAMSALHDVVVSDLRFKKKDKTAYLQWKQQQATADEAARRQAYEAERQRVEAQRQQPVPRDLERTYNAARKRYWSARRQYGSYLFRHDRDLWRMLMPCDPVITVADDGCFFECFSGDESSYGCLTVNRDGGFGPAAGAQLGTTNVDYSWDLYHHFQSLRSYRETRFRIDPDGFEVSTGGSGEHREEKIDLPQSWLRGFMQIQSAMALPATRVALSREAVYSLCAWLKRHRARTSPRAVRFELLPGRPPRVVLEPWGTVVESHGTRYNGPPVEPVRVWGARRLMVLARMLPLAESFHVHLLGTGLPHFWVANMGEMRLTLGLSGWTTNDWTRGSALDMLAAPVAPPAALVDWVAAVMRERRAAHVQDLVAASGHSEAYVVAALRRLAHAGQVIYDLLTHQYRWRQIMPQAVGEAEIGPEHEEMTGLRKLLAKGKGGVETRQPVPTGGIVLTGTVDGTPTEVLIDPDDRIKRGKCLCGHYRKYGLRNGPCRHMMALRFWGMRGPGALGPPPLPQG